MVRAPAFRACLTVSPGECDVVLAVHMEVCAGSTIPDTCVAPMGYGVVGENPSACSLVNLVPHEPRVVLSTDAPLGQTERGGTGKGGNTISSTFLKF